MLKILQDQAYRGEDWWDWSVWLDGPKEEMDAVQKVLWRLHPTFAPSTVTSTDRATAFRLRTSGWGTFTIRASAMLRDGGERQLEHELELLYPDAEAQPSQPRKGNDVGAYVRSVQVPSVPAASRDGTFHEGQLPLFRSGPQVLVIRSYILEFSAALPPELKATVSHGLLLAQLAADKTTERKADHAKWYETYRSVLTNIGWNVSAAQFQRLTVPGTATELRQAMVPLLADALGPKATAGSLLIANLEDLPSLPPDMPWLTLIQRATTSFRGARLGMSYVDSAGDDVTLTSIFLDVESTSAVTQVLFFRTANAQASVDFAVDKLTVPKGVVSGVKVALAQKVGPFVVDNIIAVET